ncbi:hypothetical protein ACFRFU_42760 [Streptomyces sp. NPDC056704]|uniref:hypothetical protein n=1 Tax=Streptomyces sp. NPDC056704 TaxID=3345917 RepID=UPI0036A9F05D
MLTTTDVVIVCQRWFASDSPETAPALPLPLPLLGSVLLEQSRDLFTVSRAVQLDQ